MFTRTLGLFCLLGLLLELGSSQTICPTGKYGVDCELVCNTNCAKNCHRVTGTCEEACVIGRYDSYCDKICNCTFGCDKETGYCPCDVYGCTTCNTGGNVCDECDGNTYFVPSSNDNSRCCSKGCATDAFGILDCNTNGVCTIQGCIDGYWGEKCTLCRDLITNCEICKAKQNTNDLICTQCLPGYDPSMDQSRCCLPGCDDCNGDVCSVCKPGYYIYNEICDTCGDNCKPPGNGTARCNPVTGECLYDCLVDWHGLKCDVECTLSNCETCDYKETQKLLTCQTCMEGWAPNEFTGFCQTCNANCVNGRCNSTTGYCLEGCMPGWRSDRCDQSCEDADMGNCTACGRDSFTCSECMFDFWGATCENSCSQNCVPVDSDHVCDKDDAACTSGCMPGYWREDCNRECPNCLNDVCQIADGICTDGACKPGYWGSDCMMTCSAMCASNPGTGDVECQFNTGICTHGCKYNQHGVLCDKTCSDHCLDNRTTTISPFDEEPLCSQLDGSCKFGCENNYYKTNCSDTCQSTCVTGKCDISAGYCLACDEVPKGWLCYDGKCNSGFLGSMCDTPCPGNCADECERYTGKCKGCDPKFWSDNCTRTCNNCLQGLCDQATGVCSLDCNPGYFDPFCSSDCVFTGCETCARESGLCITCKDELYGEACEKSCSSQCTPTAGTLHLCDKANGTCQEGSCLAGSWGLDCYQTCNINCRTDSFGDRTCYYQSGNCSNGCEDKFWDDHCDKPCSHTCQFDLCKRDATCLLGCVDNTYGAACEWACEETCNDNTCDRVTGYCAECNKTLEEQSELCRTADCDTGSRGLFCNETCPSNCNNTCHRYNSTCDGCLSGFYDDFCNVSCGNCVENTCDQVTGTCDVGCQDGYHGDQCLDPCSHDGCMSCNRSTGECIVCLPGLYGLNCSKICSGACPASDDGNVTCVKDSGACTEGFCVPGWYAPNCDMPCPENCRQSDDGLTFCKFADGFCDDGCLPGWFEPQCDVLCNSNCVDGLCNRTGYCTEGCNEELYGYFCESNCTETCNDNTCDREMGSCAECNVTDREPTFECRDAACPSGSQGLLCDTSCPSNCFEECHRYNSTCDGCDNGFYGDLCEDQCGECVGGTCDQVTGYCEHGCLDEWYGLPCRQRCPDDNCKTCNVLTGTCQECQPGYYGNICEKMCSSFCEPGSDNRIRCDRNSGFCSETQCKAGYFLKDCTKSCNDNCGQDFNQDRPCEILTGTCAYDCTPGWYGDTCDRQCSENCVDGLCNRTGFCISGCEKGFYAEDCRLTCAQSLTCNDGTCHRYNGNCSACDEPDPTEVCRTADCDRGFHGLFCNYTCPANCQGGVCIRETGLCQSCNPTWYNPTCNLRCLNCKDDICFQSNGHCIRGCKDGFYTDKCNVPCLHDGCQDCTRDNGTCITCKVAKFNSNCSEDCSPQCETTDLGFRTCSKASGYCDANECIDGYWSEKCREECSPYCGTDTCDLLSGQCEPCRDGYFGLTCRSECSPNCKNNKCNRTRDTCVEGCTNGFWGTACEKECNANCVQNMCDISTGTCTQGCQGEEFYGPACQEPCNSNCASGQCERDGYCIGVCKKGTFGDMCEHACPVKAMCTDMTCDRKAGNCSACDAIVPSTLCPSADCPRGKTGIKDCELNCTSSTCLYNHCTRDTDICVGCNIGIQGAYCDKPCGNCKVGTGCAQLSGVCDEGCRDGYHGDKCDEECDHVCESCERDSPARCVVCREKLWGSECQNNCNANCADTIIGTLIYKRCEKESGACSEGACTNNRYWSANCSIQCPINCLADGSGYKTCRISDGTCSNGCDAHFYGPQCTGICSVQCKDQRCENSANNCIRGCEVGFYNPPTCSRICSPNCLNSGKCDSTDGTCIGGCKDGYFGELCREACFGKCTDGKCDDQGGCPDCRLSPVGPLCHPQVCPTLKYGPSCESDCPGLYCTDDECERQSGKCPQGCKNWYHGEYCTERCICHTAGTVSCNQEGVCQCKVGWTSVDCSQTCSDGCRNSECEKNGQCTLGCIAGRYGSTCENSCSGCINEDCDSATGQCRVGCKSGFYGGRCDEECPDNCAACDSSARCTQCSSFLYGLPSCSSTCSVNCKPTSGRICMESNGACVDGCNTRYWGTKCDKECGFCGGDGGCSSVNGICTDGCEVGYYTPTCTTSCSDKCIVGASNTKPECNVDTGACRYGCVDGYYGNTCEECSDNCLGKKCSSATVCTDGCEAPYYGKNTGCNLDCSRCNAGRCNDTGHCISGCESGFYGHQCQTVCSKTCKDETCDQTTGECADCSKTPVGPLCKDEVVVTETEVERLPIAGIIGISAGCAVAVIIIVILMVVCIFYRRQASDAKNEIHLPSDVLERLSTHRSHHSTISSQYPVARVVGDDEKDFVLF